MSFENMHHTSILLSDKPTLDQLSGFTTFQLSIYTVYMICSSILINDYMEWVEI